MIGWLYRILIGRFTVCRHEWKIIQSGPVTYKDDQIGRYYHLQCQKCGDVKQRELTS